MSHLIRNASRNTILCGETRVASQDLNRVANRCLHQQSGHSGLVRSSPLRFHDVKFISRTQVARIHIRYTETNEEELEWQTKWRGRILRENKTHRQEHERATKEREESRRPEKELPRHYRPLQRRPESKWPTQQPDPPQLTREGNRGVYIALGSNVGDRLEAIESACRAIDADDRMQIVRTSSLYETTAMYVEEQAKFLNGVCEIRTDLMPVELLDKLQAIENDLGRVKLIDKGPRNIDLDILLYGSEMFSSERLIIPHKLMQEREFVIRPLADLWSGGLPRSRFSTAQALGVLIKDKSMKRYAPLGPDLSINTGSAQRKTLIMSILNTTPDSFSDGGSNEPLDTAALKKTVSEHIAAGAKIIDIGGQSSRPNAEDVSAEEEISRVLPAIEAVKSLPEAEGVAISVDTYRAEVAEAAVNAGAHIINDISAGKMDPAMFETIARLGCTYAMMHMRGTPATMQNLENLRYPNGVGKTVSAELMERFHMAQEAGIRSWRIIIDPGIGFAKSVHQNVRLLRHNFHTEYPEHGLKNLPVLVGSSRKRFIGEITGEKDPRKRVMGTAVTVAAAIEAGADIVRVHDVAEMAQVVRMAKRLYRPDNKGVDVLH